MTVAAEGGCLKDRPSLVLLLAATRLNEQGLVISLGLSTIETEDDNEKPQT